MLNPCVGPGQKHSNIKNKKFGLFSLGADSFYSFLQELFRGVPNAYKNNYSMLMMNNSQNRFPDVH